MENKRVLLYGYYGNSNLGDDLILDTMLSILNCFQISVNINNVDVLNSMTTNHADIEGIGTNPYHFCSEIPHYRALVIGGGGLCPHRGVRQPLVYLLFTLIAKLYRKKVIFFSIGITGEQTALSLFIWKKIIWLSDLFVVRDKAFTKHLSGKNRKKVLEAYDIVFSRSTDAPAAIAPKIVAIAPANIVGLQNNENYDIELADVFTEFINRIMEKGYDVELLSFRKTADEALCRAIAARVGQDRCTYLDYPATCQMAFSSFRRYYAVIGMRFHSLVLSAKNGIPFVPISYSHKSDELSEETGFIKLNLKYCIDARQYYRKIIRFTADELADRFVALETNYEFYSQTIAKRSEEIVKITAESIRRLQLALN